MGYILSISIVSSVISTVPSTMCHVSPFSLSRVQPQRWTRPPRAPWRLQSEPVRPSLPSSRVSVQSESILVCLFFFYKSIFYQSSFYKSIFCLPINRHRQRYQHRNQRRDRVELRPSQGLRGD